MGEQREQREQGEQGEQGKQGEQGENRRSDETSFVGAGFTTNISFSP